ncbi:MAG: hypothetical protein HQ528_08190 [Candidatus Marinimicrobia bacterium]|nr:hypothetical protein [Candidatus Neomarinimicrobiota bacterium]
MHKLLLVILIALVISLAQEDIYLVSGGVTNSSVSFNEKDIEDFIDLDDYLGYTIGIEAKKGNLIAGIRYLQRGSEYHIDDFIWAGYYYYKSEGYFLFNYASFYGYYCYSISKQISVLGGFSLGFPLESEAKIKSSGGYSDTETINADELNRDYGIELGGEFAINNTISARVMYYWGMEDVFTDLISDENVKNNGFTLNVIYQFK